MTQSYSDWLPIDALTSPAIISEFESAVNIWSERWFTDHPFDVTNVHPKKNKATTKSVKTEWRAFDNDIFLMCSMNTQLIAAEQALHISIEHSQLAKEDRNLMLAFSERILDDLAIAFSAIIEPNKRKHNATDVIYQFESSSRLELEISSVKGFIKFNVGIPYILLTKLRKRQCQAYTPQKIQTLCVADALAPVVVAYRAEIGNAKMSAFDLHNIAEGDVVMIDKLLSDPVDMISESSGRLLFTAMLEHDLGELALTAREIKG